MTIWGEGTMRRLSAVLVSLLLCSAQIGAAFAAPPAATIDDILEALQVRPQESDYVIVVDTSLSMRAEERYARVAEALGVTLTQLQPTDHVALITFDDGARVAYRGPRGDDPQAVLNELPAQPSGDQTDIGAGLELGLEELERPDAKAAGALVLITDGDLDTKPDSPFAEPTSEGWVDLKARAAALSGRDIATYALSVGEETDAGLMTGVFPDTQEIPVAQFADVLSDLRMQLLTFQAKQKLDPDLEAGALTAKFTDTKALGSGEHATTLQVSSTYGLLPTHLTGLAAEVTGSAPVTVEGLPDEVVLAPGQTVDLPLTLTVGEWDGSQSDLLVTAVADSSWSEVVRTELRTPVELALTAAPLQLVDEPVPAASEDAVAGETPQPSPSPTPLAPPPAETEQAELDPLPLIIGGAVLVLLALAALFYLSRPKLEGALTVLRDGQLVQELLLTGRSVTLTPPEPGMGPSGAASAAGKREQVIVKASVDGEKAVKAKLADGESVRVGEYELVYTGTRSRVLAKIS
ncbi:VWA domain-containing protein [Tessaracoccus sp. Y36]